MPPEIQLLELVGREKLERILKGFTEVAGVASIIADPRGRPITEPYRFTDFCHQFCRSTKEGKRRCYLSDRFGGVESLRTGKSPIYDCLNAGLMDCAAPIIVNGFHLATVLCGQVLEKPMGPDAGRKMARSIGVKDIDGYLEALQTVPIMERDRLRSVVNLMAAITQTISELALHRHLHHKLSPKYLHRLIDSVSDCIISTNLQGVISMVNEAGAEMFGYEAADLIGEPITTLFGDDSSRQAYMRQLHRKSKSHPRIEINAIKANHGFFPVQVSIARIGRRSVENADFVTVIRDISEQKKIDRMKEDFIGMVAHDIKSPILSMQKAVELLINGALGPLSSDQTVVMRMVLDTTHQLYGIVSHLLDIYRRENGRFLLEKTVFDMNDVIRESIGRLKLFAKDKRVSIHFEPSEDGMVAEGDRERIARVCMNLLENAVKYSHEDGDVTVSCRFLTFENGETPSDPSRCPSPPASASEKSWVQITVSDQGPGIPSKYHEQVFEKFFTAETGTPQGRKGLGLGLTFSRQVIEAHGGAIWVTSPTGEDESGVPRGCDFEFMIPARSRD
jgi:PAS domain S-box-containing protein